jgi:hypothetical protein
MVTRAQSSLADMLRIYGLCRIKFGTTAELSLCWAAMPIWPNGSAEYSPDVYLVKDSESGPDFFFE